MKPERTKSMRLPQYLLLFLLAGNASAAMYKWVDEEGNTHYTQSPPPGDVQAETIAPPPRVNTRNAVEQLKEQQEKADELRNQRLEVAEEQRKNEEELARKKANCELARKRLASYEEPRVKFVQEDGSRVRATEEERLEQIKISQEMIDEFCN
jgi:hypothetical protein